jgi:hypothetical protein
MALRSFDHPGGGPRVARAIGAALLLGGALGAPARAELDVALSELTGLVAWPSPPPRPPATSAT